MAPTRVLVVDDSVVVRRIISDVLATNSAVEVVGTASSGEIALAKIPQVNPDLITLDIEMPGMNGLETLVAIKKRYPKITVIMCSTLTERGAAVTLEALAAGAADYLTKPSQSESLATAKEQLGRELIAKIISLTNHPTLNVRKNVTGSKRRSAPTKIDIVAVGASTGGPNALVEVIPKFPKDFPIPIVMVQHMPPLFTRMLADRLSSRSSLPIREAKGGEVLGPGQVWVAPGNYHMIVRRTGRNLALELNQENPENSCRPAVDVLFRSVAEECAPNILGVVMTGMGSDGARGARLIHDAGGEIIVQDEPSSIVWGMPGAAVSAGVVDKICSLSTLAKEIVDRVSSRSPALAPASTD